MARPLRLACATASMLIGGVLTATAEPPGPVVELSGEVVRDKIRGGLLGQMLGNLNGLDHEFKYIDEPGNVTEYVPALPEGARTDDDTDLEWVYVVAMQDEDRILLRCRFREHVRGEPGFRPRL